MSSLFIQSYRFLREFRVLITTTLCVTCIVCVVTYSALVYTVVNRTVAIREIEHTSAELSQTVKDLDGAYLAASRKLTPDRLEAYGLREGDVSAFISRTSSLGQVSFVGHEI